MAEALAIGGWFASAAVSKLSDLIRSFISRRHKIATGVNSKLQSLERSLVKIKAVIGVVERKWLTEDPNVVSWLNDLKDAVYDAEDILDFFNYQNLRRSAEASSSEGRSSVLVNVSTKLKKAQIGAKRAFFPGDSLYNLSDVVKKFDHLSSDDSIGIFIKVIELGTNSNKQDDSFDRRQTSPVLAEAKVFGRNKEMNELLDFVLVSSDENISHGENFSVVSIVGMGGVGKTTLAQWLYNREDVQKHFTLKAWVCVSNEFDMRRVMIGIFESASRPINQDLYNRINFGTIHEDLTRLLSGKRFLIVLDDVWGDTATLWDKLIGVLRSGKEGSKIIVTTRDQKVADKVNSMTRVNLKSLEKKEYWQFFRRCAFGNIDPKDHPKLEHIGKQIASKLGGLPLAAKVVGGVLKHRLEERHWRDVLENKEWQKVGEILPSLRLSYNHLPTSLKQCFAYCALFPKDFRFKQNKLVDIWVAQGYVQSSNGSKTLEDVGREYFNELHSRSFFQKYSWKLFVIHDLLHDLAESILADEIYREENGSSVEHRIPKRVRHLFVISSDLDRVLNKIEEPKKLRSLVYDPPYTSSISQTLCPDFKKLRGLRTLILGRAYSPSYVPDTIGDMLHLRYLEFPGGIKLPISLGRLFNLQVLKLSSTQGTSKGYLFLDNPLSEIFGKLINLRHINASHSYVSAIPSIGKLKSLQKLETYEVRQQECHRICELRNLNELRGYLCIANLENVTNKEEAKKAELHNKVHLDRLTLYWNSSHCSNEEFSVYEEVLEGLQPPSNIKTMSISTYIGRKYPSWLSKSCLSNIECIKLFEWGCLKVLPPLGEFPFLVSLTLDNLISLEKIGLQAHGGGNKVFPSLKCLKLRNLKELREWSSFKEDVRDVMPLLSKLEITDCHKLEALPPLGGLQCLNHLDLWKLASLTKIGTETYGRENVLFPKLEYLRLHSIKELKEWLAPDDGRSLMPDLSKLIIADCPNLKVIPPLGELPSLMPHLRDLFIDNCPNLKVIPPLGELPTIKTLRLEGLNLLEEISIEIYGRGSTTFPSLERLVLRNMNGLTEWCALEEQGRVLIPRLHTLEIVNCHKLKWPIHYSSVLASLTFGFCENVDDAQMFHEFFPIGNLTCLEDLYFHTLKGLVLQRVVPKPHLPQRPEVLLLQRSAEAT